MKYVIRELMVREIVVEARDNASDAEVIAYAKNDVSVVESTLYEPSYMITDRTDKD